MAKDDDMNEKIGKQATVPIADLPKFLIEEILSRLPVKSLLRFRCVSKLWCDLIADPAFVKVHLSRSLASNANLSLIFTGFYLHAVDLDACEQESAVKLDHPLNSPHYATKVVGSCNGLLCVYHPFWGVFLWNPSTRTHQMLPDPSTLEELEVPHRRRSVYGLGYDPKTDDYKVMRVVYFNGDDEHYFYPEVKVYSLNTNSWRRIGDIPFHLIYIHRSGVLVISALHWVAKQKTGPDNISTVIVSFDLQDEEFREVPLPDFVDNEVHMNLGLLEKVPHSDFVDNKVYMNLEVLGGQLCVICNVLWVRVEVWVMKDYCLGESWAKLFSFSMEQPSVIRPYQYFRPICYSKKGEVILEMDSKTLILYDPASGTARKLGIRRASYRFDSFQTDICIESLVLLKNKDGAINYINYLLTWCVLLEVTCASKIPDEEFSLDHPATNPLILGRVPPLTTCLPR